jgi:tetratricopeptide (TPR) repeat protein
MMKYLLLLLFLPLTVLPQSRFDSAEALFKQKNFVQAKPMFQEYLRSNPNHLMTLEYLGDIYGQEKKWDDAISYYQRLIELKPSVANYHYKFGGVSGMLAKESNKFKALGMIGDIRSSFEKAIELDPKHIDARWALIELYLQLPAIVGGSESKAKLYANQLIKISPVDGYLAHGHIEEYLKRYSAAELNYKKAVDISGSPMTYKKLADLYKKMNQPAKAKATLALSNQKNKN